MSNVPATWSISLDLNCPKCNEHIDLIDEESFRESSINPLERAHGYETSCPYCDYEFLVDLEF